MTRQIKNNFSAFKADFKKDTGLDFNPDNMDKYIAYYHARMTDNSAQYIAYLLDDIANNTRPIT